MSWAWPGAALAWSQTRRRLCDGEILREILEDIPAITWAAITLGLVSQFKYGFYLFLKHDIEIFITQRTFANTCSGGAIM